MLMLLTWVIIVDTLRDYVVFVDTKKNLNKKIKVPIYMLNYRRKFSRQLGTLSTSRTPNQCIMACFYFLCINLILIRNLLPFIV